MEDARQVFEIPLPRVAARIAYYSMLHAAEALIFEDAGKVTKTHSGALSEFARLFKERGLRQPALPTVLKRAYTFKEVSDYNFGPNAVVTYEQADAVLADARIFIDTVASLLQT